MLQIWEGKNAGKMSSREIAELTGKEHKNVMSDIRKMLEELEKTSAEFLAELPDSYNRPQPVYFLPKDETICLVAGYDTKARMAIIKRWQDLETKEVKQLSPMELVIISAQAIMRVEQKQIEQDARLTAIEVKSDSIIEGHEFYSISGYCRLKGQKIDSRAAATMGKLATTESNRMGYMMGKIHDAKYGSVKTYHIEVLDNVFKI